MLHSHFYASDEETAARTSAPALVYYIYGTTRDEIILMIYYDIRIQYHVAPKLRESGHFRTPIPGCGVRTRTVSLTGQPRSYDALIFT